VSGPPETAPITPLISRSRPPARLCHPPSRPGIGPSPGPPFGSSAFPRRFYRPPYRPSIYKRPLALFASSSTHSPFSFSLLSPFFPLTPFFLGPYYHLRINFQPDTLPLLFRRRYRSPRS
jgi:hypothetical protein